MFRVYPAGSIHMTSSLAVKILKVIKTPLCFIRNDYPTVTIYSKLNLRKVTVPHRSQPEALHSSLLRLFLLIPIKKKKKRPPLIWNIPTNSIWSNQTYPLYKILIQGKLLEICFQSFSDTYSFMLSIMIKVFELLGGGDLES